MNIYDELRQNRAVFERAGGQTEPSEQPETVAFQPRTAGAVKAVPAPAAEPAGPAPKVRAAGAEAEAAPAPRAFSLRYAAEDAAPRAARLELPGQLRFPAAETAPRPETGDPLESLYGRLEREARLLPQPQSEEE